MPIVSDFTHILGDATKTIGDEGETEHLEVSFNTDGRFAGPNTTSFITLMVRGLTESDQDARVILNNKEVGKIRRNKNGDRNQWNMQCITMNASDLNNGNNVIRLKTVPHPNPEANTIVPGLFDDYQVTNVICHFKQNA